MHPVLIQIGGFQLASYGVMVTLGFLIGLWVTTRLAARRGLNTDQIANLAIYCALAGIAGGKLAMFLFDFDYYSADPSRIFSLSTLQAGGVFQGGLLLAVVTAWWYLRRTRMQGLPVADVLAPGLALGHSIGRVGCFLAGCCYGDRCDLPWAVTFHSVKANDLSGVPLNVPLHPTQLYESLAEALIFMTLLWLIRRPHRTGAIIGWYLVLYSSFRFLVEFVRHHDQALPFGGPFSLTQYLAAALLTGGLWLVVRKGEVRRFDGARNLGQVSKSPGRE